jgi:catechol 2,3-dioxygenase-like lactoylglutathione lyase family enzyme
MDRWYGAGLGPGELRAAAAPAASVMGGTDGFYHVCFVVPDVDRAMREAGEASGIGWRPPRVHHLAGWAYRLVFSSGGPPYVELIAGPPGSPWHTATPTLHHVGFWVDDLDRWVDRVAADGCRPDFDGRPLGRPFTYHRLPGTDLRLELLDAGAQPGFRETWDAPAMPYACWSHTLGST